MAKFFFWLGLLIVSIDAIPIPKNKWRGDGLVWRDGYTSPGLMKSLGERGIKTLVQKGGSLGWTKGAGVYFNSVRFGLSEKEWEPRYPFRNLLELELEASLSQRLSANDPVASSDLVQSLGKHLSKFDQKLDGLIFRLPCSSNAGRSFLNSWVAGIDNLGFKLGISICSNSFMSMESFHKSPDFIVLRINESEWNEVRVMDSYATRLSSWNLPFFFNVSMQTTVQDDRGIRLEASAAQQILRSELLSLVEEKIDDSGRSALMILNESVKSKNKDWFQGEKFTLTEPGNRALLKYLKLAAATESYWFSGSIVDMDSWSPRILLKDPESMNPPRVYYKISPLEQGVSIELSLENPTPIPSSGGESGAGIVLEYSGYSMKGIELGDFQRIRTFNGRGRDQLILSLSGLSSYSLAKGLKVNFRQTGDGGRVKVLGWVQPRAQKVIHYDRGSETSLLPEFAVSNLGQSVWVQGAEGTR